MPRRKVTPAETGAELPEINDGEKVIITDTRTIERKVASNDAQNGEKRVIDADFEEYDEETDATGNLNGFTPDSLAAFVLEDKEQTNFDFEYCTLNIRREPDEHGDNFLKPQKNRLSLPVMRNIPLTRERWEIEEEIRNEYGGGHYFIQIVYRGNFLKSWKADLADSPAALEKARNAEFSIATAPTGANNPTPAPSANPIDTMIADLTRLKQLKDLLFGEEQKELERLREQVSNPNTQQQQPENEKIALLKFAVDSKNEKLIEKTITTLFGEEAGGWIDAAKFIFENDEKILNLTEGLVRRLVTGVTGGKGEAPPTKEALKELLKGKNRQPNQPKAELPPPEAKSTFRRKTAAAPSEAKEEK